MALETLKGVKEIGGFKAESTDRMYQTGKLGCSINDYIWTHSFRGKNPAHIFVDHQRNAITFKIQDGPIKENGVNGCQVDTLIHAAKNIIEELNKKFPCKENEMAIEGLGISLYHLGKRKEDREKRNVEGLNKL